MSDSAAQGAAPALMDVAAVMARYGLRDRRAARRVMDEAGAFKVGAGLFVRLDDLLALEEQRRASRRSPGNEVVEHRPAPPGSVRSRGRRQPLAPGWWRESDGAGRQAG